MVYSYLTLAFQVKTRELKGNGDGAWAAQFGAAVEVGSVTVASDALIELT